MDGSIGSVAVARVFAVVPARDEAERLGEVLRTLPPWIERAVVVDDGSRDATAAIAAAHPRTSLIRHPRAEGVGAALRSGYRAAFAAGADIAVVLAGDGQMDPADLPALIEPLLHRRADYAKGTRLRSLRVIADMPWPRLVGNLGLTLLTRWSTGLPITDAQCGYTALTRQAAQALELETLWPRYGYPNDLLARCARRALRVVEVPVRAVYRGEKSGVRLRDALFTVPFVIARGRFVR